MNQHLAQIAEALDSAETIGNIVRTNTIDGGHVLVEFSPTAFGGYENAEAAAKLFKAATKLFEALQACLQKGSRWHPCDPVVVQARAAIREATE